MCPFLHPKGRSRQGAPGLAVIGPAAVLPLTGKDIVGVLLVPPVAPIHHRHLPALGGRYLFEIDICPACQLHNIIAQLADIVAHLTYASQLKQVEDTEYENREYTQDEHNHDPGA